MKVGVLLISIFLLAFTLVVNVSAQPDTGSTIINATIKGILKLYSSLEYPEIIIPEDYYFFENITLFHDNSQNISVHLNKTDTNNFVKFVNQTQNDTYYQDNYTLFLPSFTYENVTLRVYVQPGMGYEGGTYNIPIYATSLNDSRTNSTTLKVKVNNTNPIDDVQILSIYPSSLYSGESLAANISIHKLYPTDTTDVQICYCIDPNPVYQCGPAYNDYGCEWRAINEWLNYTKNVTVSESPGNYYFMVAVQYPGDSNIKRANSPKFLVKQVPGPPTGDGAPPGLAAAPQVVFNITAPDYLEAAPGERIIFNVEIKNTGSASAPNTSLDIYGIPENWFSISPYTQDIGIDGSKNYSVFISLPGDAAERIYPLSLAAKSGDVEETRDLTLTVAMTPERQARFLLGEALSNKNRAEGITDKAKIWGMDTKGAENIFAVTNDLLNETQRLFESGNYEVSIKKAKEAIDGYKLVISSVNEIVEKAYLLLLSGVTTELGNIERITEEKDVVDTIKEKINQSIILRMEKRIPEAYQTLLEAKQLLDQLKGKIFFMEMTQNTVIVSILVVLIVSISMVVFYKKKMSKLLKKVSIEEHKRKIKSLFKKEVRPSIPRKEIRKEKPKVHKERLEEIHRLLEAGEASVDTDLEKAKGAYTSARKIYNSLSAEERKLIKDEGIRLMRLYNNITKQIR